MNFYEAPKASLSPTTFFRDKKYIVGKVQDEKITLPDFCIKCGEGGLRNAKRMSWMPSWGFLFIFLGGIGVVLAYLFTARHARVIFTVCDVHSKERKVMEFSMVALFLLMAFCFIKSIFWAGMIFLVLFILAAVKSMRFLRLAKVKDGLAWIQGAGPNFLKRLPDLPPD